MPNSQNTSNVSSELQTENFPVVMRKYLEQLEVAKARELLLDNLDKVRSIDSLANMVMFMIIDYETKHEH